MPPSSFDAVSPYPAATLPLRTGYPEDIRSACRLYSGTVLSLPQTASGLSRKLRGRMSRLPAEKHIAADPARTGIVEPVPNTAVIFEIRNLGVIPISIMEDRRLDIQTFDLTSGCRQTHERILTSGEERSLIVK